MAYTRSEWEMSTTPRPPRPTGITPAKEVVPHISPVRETERRTADWHRVFGAEGDRD